MIITRSFLRVADMIITRSKFRVNGFTRKKLRVCKNSIFIRRGMIMKFSERLKTIRESRNLTQVQLAKLSGVSERMIQNYEGGIHRPRIEVAEKLAKALNITADELLGNSGMLIVEAEKKGGAKSARDVKALVDEVIGMFAGGSLPQEDKDAYMNAISRAYFESKEENKKYTPKKYRK